MITGLAATLIAASLAVAAWSFVVAVLDRPVGNTLIAALAVLEVGLLAQDIIAVVLMIGGDRPGQTLAFVGYLLAILIILPIGTVWALAEPGRWGTAVVTAACLVIPVMIVRLQQTWAPGG